MSIQVFNVSVRDKNGELRSERTILLKYLNKVASESRKSAKGKTYDELDAIEDKNERLRIFYNRLGFFENNLKDLARELAYEITYKKHKKELIQISKETNIVDEVINRYDYENKCYTGTPESDCDEIVKELRKVLKRIVVIYEEHDVREELVRGYGYHK